MSDDKAMEEPLLETSNVSDETPRSCVRNLFNWVVWCCSTRRGSVLSYGEDDNVQALQVDTEKGDPGIFNGVWEIHENDEEGMDAYLKELGVGMFKRGIARSITTTMAFECTDGRTIRITNKTKLGTRDMTVTIGVPFQHRRPANGQVCSTTYTMTECGSLLAQNQSDPESSQTWTLLNEDTFVMILNCKDAKAMITYKKVQSEE